jgi:DNA-binding MarR family transcriptional regulator
MNLDMPEDVLATVRYEDRPAMLLIADTEEGLGRGREAAAQAGCRVLGEAMLEEACDRLHRQAAADMVFADLVSASERAEAALRELDRAVSEERFGVVVESSFDLLDLVAAVAPRVTHLCAPSALERHAEIRRAAIRAIPLFHDSGKDKAPAILQQISEEMGRFAAILASLSEEERAAARGGEAEEPEITAAEIRAILRVRRMRDEHFRSDIFADPAWDIMLDLMAARIEGKRVGVSSLCIAAAVPPTTALRWIKRLSDEQILVRTADPNDGRRVYIELADDAAKAVAAYLKEARRVSPFPA